MAKLFKQVNLWISRAYYHGGSGLEYMGFRIFSTKEEYYKQAKENAWLDGNSFKSSWCVIPVEIPCWVPQKKFWKIKEGKLGIEDVSIPLGMGYKLESIKLH